MRKSRFQTLKKFDRFFLKNFKKIGLDFSSRQLSIRQSFHHKNFRRSFFIFWRFRKRI
jgi:hypothetical protein